jgi:hypothetical protein
MDSEYETELPIFVHEPKVVRAWNNGKKNKLSD